jgi:hypothetical protein
VGLHGPGHQEGTAQVHVDDGVPVVVGHREQQAVAQDPGVVDQDRRRTELGRDAVHRVAHLVRPGHVGGDADRASAGGADGSDRLGGGLLGQVQDGDVPAVGGEPPSDRRTDPARGARDDRDAPVPTPCVRAGHTRTVPGSANRRPVLPNDAGAVRVPARDSRRDTG